MLSAFQCRGTDVDFDLYPGPHLECHHSLIPGDEKTPSWLQTWGMAVTGLLTLFLNDTAAASCPREPVCCMKENGANSEVHDDPENLSAPYGHWKWRGHEKGPAASGVGRDDRFKTLGLEC
ncbi:hypothetical protein ACRRTK_011099 [Alexandromys fortis]